LTGRTAFLNLQAMNRNAGIAVALFCSVWVIRGNAQTRNSDSLSFNKRLYNHYSYSELADLRDNSPGKYQSVCLYFLSSYTIQQVSCSNCTPEDLTRFDITPYEHLRKKHERVTVNREKYGYVLVLLSADELNYAIPILNFAK
jgi:hypothetical protein